MNSLSLTAMVIALVGVILALSQSSQMTTAIALAVLGVTVALAVLTTVDQWDIWERNGNHRGNNHNPANAG